MTPSASPASIDSSTRIRDEETISARIIAVAIKDERAKEALLKHLDQYPDMQSCKLVMLHIVRPQWLETEPHSGVGGQRMMIEHRDQLVFASAILEDLKHALKAKYPLLKIEYRIKSGDVFKLLPHLVESIDADRLLIFKNNNRGIPRLGKSLEQKLSERCSCPVDQVTINTPKK